MIRIDASETHFEMCQRLEDTLRTRANRVTVMQEWPLRTEHTKNSTMIISAGGDGTYLHISSMIENDKIPIMGINTHPSKSMGILCNKFMYRNRTKQAQINKIFD